MNLLTGVSTNSLVRYLPLQASRTNLIKKLLIANTAIYGTYLISSGPGKLNLQARFTAGPNTFHEGLIYFHFMHTSLAQFLFTSGVLYTIGNYHVAAYGARSFLTLFGASALGGSILTAAGLKSGTSSQTQAGAMAPAAGLIAYHVLKNPGWFKFMVGPISSLALLTLYGAYYGDRAAFGGIGAGYIAFLIGL